jgi:putative Mg2+ transporter-C (MgtC) family protein
MITSIDQTAFNLGVATLLGACIGFERQWRQRMAGLRTNTLVAIGAASFVVFESLFPDDASPTRVAAQVVSGIGFLGAGIIFREGLQVTGLNTAATLWCSAAVGLLAGSGHPLHAAAATMFVVLVNLTLRPLVRIINRQPLVQTETDFHYSVRVVCRSPEEAHVRRSHRAAHFHGKKRRRAGAGRRPPQSRTYRFGRKLERRTNSGITRHISGLAITKIQCSFRPSARL